MTLTRIAIGHRMPYGFVRRVLRLRHAINARPWRGQPAESLQIRGIHGDKRAALGGLLRWWRIEIMIEPAPAVTRAWVLDDPGAVWRDLGPIYREVDFGPLFARL